MKKVSANTIIPGLSVDLILDKLRRYGPQAAAGGAGLAALSHILNLMQNNEGAQDPRKKDNTLTIQVPTNPDPSKFAGFGQAIWDDGATVGAGAAAGGLGYLVVDQILKKYRQKQMNDELTSVKKQYSQYLGQELAPKTASDYPKLDGLLIAITEQIQDVPVDSERKQAALNIIQKSAAVAPTSALTAMTSLPSVGALLAAVVAHQVYYNRLTDQDRAVEKDEADKIKKEPQYVKVVSQDPNQPKLADEGSGILEGGLIATLLNKSKVNEKHAPAAVKEEEKSKPIFSDKDVTDVSPNTTVLSTDGGNVQISALDPEALQALQGHKDEILKGFALGANVK